MFVPIIYQDEDLLVVNKPIGLTTHPTESEDPATADVVSAVKRQLGLVYVGLHHRLDREVSGVLAFAARKEANANMAKVFEGRSVQKEYLAIVAGRLPRSEGEINAVLTEVSSGRYAVAKLPDRRAQAARTRYKVEQTTADGKFSLVRLWLDTGRTHQLRVHLAFMGAPIVGDAIYGSAQKFPRLLLHAALLRFAHPGTGHTATFEAAPPPLFKRLQAGEALPEIELAQRLLTHERGLALLNGADEVGLGHLLDLATLRRTAFLADPTQQTTGYCLINGSGDGLPGLLVDCFGQTLVIDPQLRTTQPAFGLVQELLARKFPGFKLHLKEDFNRGPEANSTQDYRRSGPQTQANPPPTKVLEPSLRLRENGLDFETPPELFGLDLREMRERVRAWSKGQTVLNCFGPLADIGVVAMKGGATRVVNLDASLPNLGYINYRLNGFEPDPLDFVQNDVPKGLGELARQQQKFDLVILNQPTQDEAYQVPNYPRLARLAGQIIAPGGRLIAISSDDQLERRKFRDQLVKGLQEAGRKAIVAGVYHEPELDFPRFGEAEGYLKVLVIKLD